MTQYICNVYTECKFLPARGEGVIDLTCDWPQIIFASARVLLHRLYQNNSCQKKGIANLKKFFNNFTVLKVYEIKIANLKLWDFCIFLNYLQNNSSFPSFR